MQEVHVQGRPGHMQAGMQGEYAGWCDVYLVEVDELQRGGNYQAGDQPERGALDDDCPPVAVARDALCELARTLDEQHRP